MKSFNKWVESLGTYPTASLIKDPYRHDEAIKFLNNNINKSFPVAIDPRSNDLFIFTQGTPDWFVNFLKYINMNMQQMPVSKILEMDKMEYEFLIF